MPRQSRLIVLTLATALLQIPCSRAADSISLPRKNGGGPGKDEAYPGVIVLYDAIRDAAGRRLRLIATHPDHPQVRYPAIFVVGWLSCDTIEAPPGTTDGTQRMLQSVAQTPGFAMVRLEKPGVGDSEVTVRGQILLPSLRRTASRFSTSGIMPLSTRTGSSCSE